MAFERAEAGSGEWLRSRLQRLGDKAVNRSDRARSGLSERAKELRPAVAAAKERVKGAARTAWRDTKGHMRHALQKGLDAIADDEVPAQPKNQAPSTHKESPGRQSVVILYRDPQREQPSIQQVILKPSGGRSN